MSDVALLWVGRRAPAPIEELATEYKRRLARHLSFDEIRVKPAVGRDGDPRRVLAEEAAALRRHMSPGDWVVALDERGSEKSTEELARWIALGKNRGRVALVIGSDLGLDAEFRRHANELLALSRLTLPHQLARLLLLEQLYRTCDLLAGGSYHRGDAG